jgi:transcriptional regulator with XRE-family HTH domain
VLKVLMMARRPLVSPGRLRHFADRAGYKTDTDLADSIGVSYAAVSLWLNGKNSPTAANLRKFAKACGVDLQTLVFGDLGVPEARE